MLAAPEAMLRITRREEDVADRAPTRPTSRTVRTWRQLPFVARVFVGLVCVLGGTVIVWSLPAVRSVNGILFTVLLGLAVPASIAKLSFPRSASTLTLGQVIDFVTLLALGPQAAVLIAATGAWSQCTFRSRLKNPRHQTLFSISCLAIAVLVAGAVYVWLGGRPGVWDPAHAGGPLTAAAATLFVVNSGLVAAAIGLSTEQSAMHVWWETLIWSWPAYLLGAGVAAATVAGIHYGGYWLAPFLGVALILTFHNLRAYFARVSESVTDPLTGLPNLRFVLPHALREVGRAQRSRTSLAIVVVDLDGFKSINDKYGHRAGDLVLRRVAHCLQQSIGPDDVCARYGGDEFLIVLSGCNVLQAARRSEELCASVAALRFVREIGSDTALALSVGVAVFPDDGESLEELLETADARMYRNKFAPKRGPLRPRAGHSTVSS